MPDDIYWRDSLAWSEQQAGLLERLAKGERVNEEIDWENIVEEVLSVGRSQLQSVESLLTRGLEHIMKIHGWPQSRAVNHWQVEALAFLLRAQRPYSPSMRTRIDLAGCYRDALLPLARLRIDEAAPRAIPAACPFTVADLLPPDGSAPDIDALVATLSKYDFFFEKKKQKTFTHWTELTERHARKYPKVFWFFFKKELLSSFFAEFPWTHT